MSKRAFIFPGQGSQYVGMAKEFYDNYTCAKEVFELAGKASGLDVAALCFEENEQIHITEYTQICMLTAEMAIYQVLKEQGITADVTAGLSLGEYGALIVSGALSMEDAFRLVRKRGLFMQEAVPSGGAMSAVLGLDAQAIAECCEKTSREMGLTVAIANDNCPGQIVISGHERAVAAAGESLKAAGARRVLPLKVSGPFHSAMLTGAGDQLTKEMEQITFSKITVPYLTNVTADYVTDEAQIPELLRAQVSSQVRWRETMNRLIADGVDEFVEIGPGRTLSGFLRKIDRRVSCISIDHLEDFKNYVNR